MAIKTPDPKLSKVIEQLKKLGYAKVIPLKKTVAAVYVPKSDRAVALSNIEKKLKGNYETSSKAQREGGSSIGGVYLKNGMMVTAKPDASKSLNTDQQETLQGIFIAAKMKNSRTKYSMSDLSIASQKMVQSKYSIEDLYEIAGKGWLESSRLAAEAVYDFLGRHNYVICQRSDSKFVTNISNAATKLIRESGKKMGIDKWNPADIWLVKKKFLNHNFKQYTSILDLNEFIYEAYKSKDIVGVSLKATKKKAKVQIFNDGIKRVYEYQGYSTGKTFISSMGNTINFTGGSISFRLFGRLSDVIGEINGKHAAGGKVGGGPLFSIIREYDKGFQVPAWKQIVQMYDTKPGFVISQLYKLKQEIDPSDKMTDKVLAKSISEKGPGAETYIVSKWHASAIVKSFEGMKKAKRNDCIKEILGYASSETEISSIFIKVS